MKPFVATQNLLAVALSTMLISELCSELANAKSFGCLPVFGCLNPEKATDFSVPGWFANLDYHSTRVIQRVNMTLSNPFASKLLAMSPSVVKLAEMFSTDQGRNFVKTVCWYLSEVKGHPLDLLIENNKTIGEIVGDMQEHNEEIATMIQIFIDDDRFPSNWTDMAYDIKLSMTGSAMKLVKNLPDLHRSTGHYIKFFIGEDEEEEEETEQDMD